MFHNASTSGVQVLCKIREVISKLRTTQHSEFVCRQEFGIITDILSYSFKLSTLKFWLQEKGLNVLME
jgi:hypothetical protein